MMVNTGRQCLGCLGDTTFTPDLTSTDSPGESGDVYAAFAYGIVDGGCSYANFTPEACNAATEALTRGYNNGSLVVNTASYHAQGETAPYMYLLYKTASPGPTRGSSEAGQMIARAAADLGIRAGQYIAPNLPSFVPQTVVANIPESVVPYAMTNQSSAVSSSGDSSSVTHTVQGSSNPITDTVSVSMPAVTTLVEDFRSGLSMIAKPSDWLTVLHSGNAGEIVGLLSPLIAVGVLYMFSSGKRGRYA
jgi:hypothetical protein